MVRIVASFALGAFVTSAAFLWWGGWRDGEAITHQRVSFEAETTSREDDDVALEPSWDSADGVNLGDHRQNPSAATVATQPPAADPATDRDPESQEGSLFARPAMGTTREEIEQGRILSATIAFDSRPPDPTSTSLEGILVNEAWSTVPTASSPIALDTECRASVCRIRFEFGTDEGLGAAAQSELGVRMLDAVEQYGFEAVNMIANADDRSRTLDVYLWRDREPTP